MDNSISNNHGFISTILDNIIDAVITTDENGIIHSFNKSAQHIFGYTPEEIIGRSVSVLMPDPISDEHPSYMQRYISTGIPHVVGIGRESVAARKDGQLFPVSIAIGEFSIDGRHMFTGIIRDITSVKNAELKERKLHEELIIADRSASLGRVAAGIAHEINNPLAAIHTDLQRFQLLGDKIIAAAENLPPDNPVRTDVLKNADKIIAALVRDISAISRINNIINAMRSSLRPERWITIDMHSEIDFQVSLIAGSVKGRIEIIKNYCHDTIRIRSCGSQIGQVILNLLTNAVDAMTSGTITITTENHPESAIIEITDTGSGISNEHLANIFEPFFTTKSVGHGTGLGLNISRQIAKNHCGRLFVKNTELGHGTTFRFEISKKSCNDTRNDTHFDAPHHFI